MTEFNAEKFAAAICGAGTCFCGYNCRHANKAPNAIPLIGSNVTCPLARFNAKPDTRNFWERLEANDVVNITENDCWTFCAEHCEHAEVSADGTIRLKDFDDVCIDCPVQQARESLSESAAES